MPIETADGLDFCHTSIFLFSYSLDLSIMQEAIQRFLCGNMSHFKSSPLIDISTISSLYLLFLDTDQLLLITLNNVFLF